MKATRISSTPRTPSNQILHSIFDERRASTSFDPQTHFPNDTVDEQPFPNAQIPRSYGRQTQIASQAPETWQVNCDTKLPVGPDVSAHGGNQNATYEVGSSVDVQLETTRSTRRFGANTSSFINSWAPDVKRKVVDALECLNGIGMGDYQSSSKETSDIVHRTPQKDHSIVPKGNNYVWGEYGSDYSKYHESDQNKEQNIDNANNIDPALLNMGEVTQLSNANIGDTSSSNDQPKLGSDEANGCPDEPLKLISNGHFYSHSLVVQPNSFFNDGIKHQCKSVPSCDSYLCDSYDGMSTPTIQNYPRAHICSTAHSQICSGRTPKSVKNKSWSTLDDIDKLSEFGSEIQGFANTLSYQIPPVLITTRKHAPENLFTDGDFFSRDNSIIDLAASDCEYRGSEISSVATMPRSRKGNHNTEFKHLTPSFPVDESIGTFGLLNFRKANAWTRISPTAAVKVSRVTACFEREEKKLITKKKQMARKAKRRLRTAPQAHKEVTSNAGWSREDNSRDFETEYRRNHIEIPVTERKTRSGKAFK